MSIHDRLAALGEELHLTGFGSELNEAVSRVSHFFADEIHKLGGGAAAAAVDVDAFKATLETMLGERLSALLKSLDLRLAQRLDELKGEFEKAFADANGNIDQRIETKFAELLAKAAAADKPADSPAEVKQPEAAPAV